MVKLGMVGLGRIGKSHALNLQRNPHCRIVAACSLVAEELGWAKEQLGVEATYLDYQQLLQHPGLDAVFLASSSDVHAPQIIAAIQAGKHVFCEKPLGLTIAECERVCKVVEAGAKGLCFTLGFVRRFDPAYSYAYRRMQEGAIGTPYMVRSQTVDHRDFAPFQLNFIRRAGGIFRDFCVHDIDLTRWFLQAEIETAYSTASSVAFPEFGRQADADNAVVSCQCSEGKLAIIQANRNSTHGYDTMTEILGTEGILRVGFRPSWADVKLFDKNGARDECVYTFFDRFSEAFRNEADEFINCIVEGRPSTINVRDGLAASIAAEAFDLSFREQRVVKLSELYQPAPAAPAL